MKFGSSVLRTRAQLPTVVHEIYHWYRAGWRVVAIVSAIGNTPSIRAANGGLDANWMVRHGVPTVTFGAGQNEPHTIDEWINRDEYDRACALAVQLATMR